MNWFLELLALFFVVELVVGCTTQTNTTHLQGNHFVNEYVQGAHYRDVTYNNTVTTTGLSMAPTIFQGNTVLMREYRNETLKEGQIISYTVGNVSISHRIIAVYSDYVITKGDNNIVSESVNITDIHYLVVGILYT